MQITTIKVATRSLGLKTVGHDNVMARFNGVINVNGFLFISGMVREGEQAGCATMVDNRPR